jgi:hypothetical protein
MSDRPVPATVAASEVARRPQMVTLPADGPSFSELFTFMRDAELRFDSLRMRILDRKRSAAGEQTEVIEVWLRHPGRAKVITRHGTEQVRGNFQAWLSDGESVITYDARSSTRTIRPVRRMPEGATRSDMPSYARVYVARTDLPAETLVNTFVHPQGLCRNLLTTGPLEVVGDTTVAGREALVLRVKHPRRAEVHLDRPDRWIEVTVDRQTGLILRLVEGVGDHVARDATVADLELDPIIGDEVFQLYLSDEVARIY